MMERQKRTLESREKDPAHYTVIVSGEREKLMKNIHEGAREWAVCINMWSGEIYIGSDHHNMRVKYNIPNKAYCAAIADVDAQSKQVSIKNSFDYRHGDLKALEDPEILKAIAEAMQESLLG